MQLAPFHINGQPVFLDQPQRAGEMTLWANEIVGVGSYPFTDNDGKQTGVFVVQKSEPRGGWTRFEGRYFQNVS
jgi:hypothetical protein